MKVLVTDYAWPDLKVEQRVLGEIGVELVPAPDGDEDTLAHLAVGCCGILTCWARTTKRVMEAALPDLKVVSRYGVGLDNIDVEFATSVGIPVTRVPDYCLPDVAEHAMALLLAMSRKVARFDRQVRKDIWDIQSGVPLRRLSGQTLGLVGFGQIAREVVPRAKAFGLHILAYSPSLTADTADEVGVEAVDLQTLLKRSDYVSIHCPSTSETSGMVNLGWLAKMKSSACLVNTSRGDLIDEEALVKALEKGEIAGAALDVRCSEPPEAGDKLIKMDQVLHTPHSAFYSAESLVELQQKTAWEARRVLTGEEPKNLVNPGYRA